MRIGIDLELRAFRVTVLVESLRLDVIAAGGIHGGPDYHVIAVRIDGHVRLVARQPGRIGVDLDVGRQRIIGSGRFRIAGGRRVAGP